MYEISGGRSLFQFMSVWIGMVFYAIISVDMNGMRIKKISERMTEFQKYPEGISIFFLEYMTTKGTHKLSVRQIVIVCS